MPEMRSVFAERVSQGFYINVEVNRAEAARYGLTVGDVQRAVTRALAAKTSPRMSRAASAIRSTFATQRDFRDKFEKLRRVLIHASGGAQVPHRRSSPRFRFLEGRR